MMSQPFCGAGISRGEAVGMAFQINPGLTSPLSVDVSGGGVGAVLCARVELNAGSAIRDGSVGSSMRCGLLIPNRQDIMQMGISDILGIPEQATKDTIQCPGGYPMWLLVLFVVIVVSDFNSSLFIQPRRSLIGLVHCMAGGRDSEGWGGSRPLERRRVAMSWVLSVTDGTYQRGAH